MKLPKPPIPRSLQTPPAAPGRGRRGRRTATRPSRAAKPTAQGAARPRARSRRVGWLDERTGASPFLRGFLFRKVPKGTNWFYTLGSATMFAFLVAGRHRRLPGDVLRARPRRAPTSRCSTSTTSVFLGELVRGMHRWGATVMVVLVFLHMGRTFFFGAYKYPRELNWIIGVVLLILTMADGLHGLPAAVRPALLLGHGRRREHQRLRPDRRARTWPTSCAAAPEFGATTLSRFYAIHMLLIPGLIAALIGAHLYLVAKLGTTAPPWLKAEKSKALAKEEV